MFMGPTSSKAYHKTPSATAAAIDYSGWSTLVTSARATSATSTPKQNFTSQTVLVVLRNVVKRREITSIIMMWV